MFGQAIGVLTLVAVLLAVAVPMPASNVTPSASVPPPAVSGGLVTSGEQYAGLEVTVKVSATITIPVPQVKAGDTLTARLHLEITGTLEGGLCPPGSKPSCYIVVPQPPTRVKDRACTAVAFLGSAREVGAYPAWGLSPGGVRYLGSSVGFSNTVRDTPAPGVADLRKCTADEVRTIDVTVTHLPPPGDHGYVNRFTIVSDVEYRYAIPTNIQEGAYALGLFYVPNEAVFSFARFAWWTGGQLPGLQVGDAQMPPTATAGFAQHSDEELATACGHYRNRHAALTPLSTIRTYAGLRNTICREALRFGISPLLLAATLQHEGYNRSKLVQGRVDKWLEFQGDRLPGKLKQDSIGVGQMVPATAQFIAQKYFDEYDDLGEREIRRKLVYDTDFAVRMAAGYLHEWQSFGLTDRQAFIAYAYGLEDLSELQHTNFQGSTLARKRGQRYDQLVKEITERGEDFR
jgi:hypothetical protein